MFQTEATSTSDRNQRPLWWNTRCEGWENHQDRSLDEARQCAWEQAVDEAKGEDPSPDPSPAFVCDLCGAPRTPADPGDATTGHHPRCDRLASSQDVEPCTDERCTLSPAHEGPCEYREGVRNPAEALRLVSSADLTIVEHRAFGGELVGEHLLSQPCPLCPPVQGPEPRLGAGDECDGGDWCTERACQWSAEDAEFYVSFSRGGMDYDDQPCPCEHHDEWRKAVAR